MKKSLVFLTTILVASVTYGASGASGKAKSTSQRNTVNKNTAPSKPEPPTVEKAPTAGAITKQTQERNQVMLRNVETERAEDELISRGYENTPTGIRRFQRENGLEETGVLDFNTMDSLQYNRLPSSVTPDEDVD